MSIFFESPINILSFFRLENDGTAESQLAYLEDSSTLENILQRLEQFEVCETSQHTEYRYHHFHSISYLNICNTKLHVS